MFNDSWIVGFYIYKYFFAVYIADTACRDWLN